MGPPEFEVAEAATKASLESIVLRARDPLDDAPNPLGRDVVGVLLAFDNDEAPAAAVCRVLSENRVGRGTGARERIQDDGVRVGRDLEDSLD